MTDFSAKILDAWQKDDAARLAAHALRSQQLNQHVYAVGGVCRDIYAGREHSDIDLLVTGASPAQVAAILEGLPGWTDMTGKDFGVFRYKVNGFETEIALPRTDISTGVKHTDFDVNVDPNLPLESDLRRRDFTCNAIAFNLFNHTVSDPHGGRQDITKNIIRTVNEDSFRDDPLRMMRVLVLAARFNMRIHYKCWYELGKNASLLKHVAPDRIQWELDKIFEADDPSYAMDYAIACRLIDYIFPEFVPSLYYDQNNPHHDNLLHIHALNTLRLICKVTKDKDLRLAAFLHDIGKPASAWVDPVTGSNHYYEKHFNINDFHVSNREDVPNFSTKIRMLNHAEFAVGHDHEVWGAGLIGKMLTNLRYPVARVVRVSNLVKHHMWAPFTTTKGARRFLNSYGEHADDLMTLRWADQGGKTIYPATPEHDLMVQQGLVDKVREEGQATKTADLAINGHDLINIGIPQGPIIGEILNTLTDEVIEYPIMNIKQTLLERAREIAFK